MRGSWRMASLATAIAAVLALPAFAAAKGARLVDIAQTMAHDGPVVALPFVSPPPRLHRPMVWAHQSRARQLSVHFASTQTHAVVGLERPGDAAAVATAHGVTVLSIDPGLHVMEVWGSPARLNELAHALDQRIRFVQPLLRRQMHRLRNDPALLTTDPITGRPYEWSFLSSHADLALNLSKGSPQILVGVIDTGVTEVPDLAGKIAGAWYFANAESSAEDIAGHGTAVSSIIAAPADDGIGIAGYGGTARVVMFRDRQLNGYSDATAMRKLVDLGVRVINMSYGGVGLSFAEQDAIRYATNAGVLLVASTGNDGTGEIDFPAAAIQAAGGAPGPGLSVGASTVTDTRVDFSDWGPELSLLAPGAYRSGDCQEGIYSPLPDPAYLWDGVDRCSRAFIDDRTHAHYRYIRGTSFASPEVAGAAALLWAARPELTSTQVASYLEQGTGQGSWNPDSGWGVLDVAHALELATGKSAADTIAMGAISFDAAPTEGQTVQVVVPVSWQDDGTALKSPQITCVASADGSILAATTPTYDGRVHCSWPIPAESGGQKLEISVSATDAATGTHASQTLARTIVDPRAPEIRTAAASGRWGRTVRLGYSVTEETGVAREQIVVRRNTVTIARRSAPFSARLAGTFAWNAPRAPTTGRYSFCVQAWDRYGNASVLACAPIHLS